MKIIKKILICILMIILTLVITSLSISCCIKTVFNDGLINNIIKEELVNEASDILKNNDINIQNEDMEKYKEKIENNEQINEIINNYIDQTISSLTEDEEIDTSDFNGDIESFIKENKNILENELNIRIPDEKIEEITNDAEKILSLDDNYKQIISSAKKQLSSEQQSLLKLYKYIISNNFKILIICIIAAILVLIALLQKSFYKWIINLGIASTISSIFTVLFAITLKIIVNYELNSKPNLNVNININPILISSLITLIVGILLITIYNIIRIFVNKREKVHFA